MAQTPTRLYGATPSTSYGPVYTVPTGKTVIVKQVYICNTSNATATITIGLAGNYILYTYSIAALAILSVDLTQVLVAGETIAASASTNAFAVLISGVVSP